MLKRDAEGFAYQRLIQMLGDLAPVYNTTTKPTPFPSSEREKVSFAAGKLLNFDFERS